MFSIKRQLFFFNDKANQLSALPQPKGPWWHSFKLAPPCVHDWWPLRSSGLLMAFWCMQASLPFYPYKPNSTPPPPPPNLGDNSKKAGKVDVCINFKDPIFRVLTVNFGIADLSWQVTIFSQVFLISYNQVAFLHMVVDRDGKKERSWDATWMGCWFKRTGTTLLK